MHKEALPDCRPLVTASAAPFKFFCWFLTNKTANSNNIGVGVSGARRILNSYLPITRQSLEKAAEVVAMVAGVRSSSLPHGSTAIIYKIVSGSHLF